MSNYKQITPLLLIMIVAWLGRLYALDADSLWGDEVLSLHRASQADLRSAWEMRENSNHPPMYELGILYPWLKFGDNEFLLRFPSVFFGTLTVGAIYVLGKTVFDAKIGAISALLLAISPLHIYYSREARMYALLACLITLEIYCLHKAIRSPLSAGKYWVGFALLGAASLYTHYYAGFTLWSLTGFMLIRLTTDWDFALFKRWAPASLGIVAMFSPWITILRRHLHNRPVSWIQPTSFYGLLRIPVDFFAKREVMSEEIWQIVSWSVWAALASCITYLFKHSSRARQKMRGELLVSSVVGTFLVAFLFSARRPLIVARYFVGILPVTFLLVVLGVCHLRPRYLAVLLSAILLIVSSFSGYRTVTARWQEDWRAVTTYIEAKSLPGDTILLFFPVASEFWRMPFDHYYDGDLRVSCLQGELGSTGDVDAILSGLRPYDRVWMVQSARFTRGGPLNDDVGSLPATHEVLFRERFDDQILLSSRVVDVLCLKHQKNSN